ISATNFVENNGRLRSAQARLNLSLLLAVIIERNCNITLIRVTAWATATAASRPPRVNSTFQFARELPMRRQSPPQSQAGKDGPPTGCLFADRRRRFHKRTKDCTFRAVVAAPDAVAFSIPSIFSPAHRKLRLALLSTERRSYTRSPYTDRQTVSSFS